MAVTWAQVVLIAPELSSVPVATQTVLLAITDRQIDDDVWLDMADDGRCYLAAHYGTLFSSDPNVAGPVVSESLGPMSRSYANLAGDDELAMTKYGRIFLGMVRLLPTALGLVV